MFVYVEREVSIIKSIRACLLLCYIAYFMVMYSWCRFSCRSMMIGYCTINSHNVFSWVTFSWGKSANIIYREYSRLWVYHYARIGGRQFSRSLRVAHPGVDAEHAAGGRALARDLNAAMSAAAEAPAQEETHY